MVYIDSHNRTIVQGIPFFPLGLYTGCLASEDVFADLDLMAKSPFNCVLNYAVPLHGIEFARKYLEAIEARKLMLILSVKNMWDAKLIDDLSGEKALVRVVKEFRKRPGVLAWYIMDEAPSEQVPSLEARYRQLCELDPDHPISGVLCQMNRDLNLYKNTTDIIGSDPYPIGSVGIETVTRYVKATNAAFDNRALWMVPQCMNLNVYMKLQAPIAGPTYEEMRNMTFQCLVGGAMGLIYYSFDDLKRDPLAKFDKSWADLCKTVGEVKGLSPFLLSTQKRPAVKMKGSDEHVLYATRSLDGRNLLMVVNISREEQTCEFAFPTKPKSIKRLDGNGKVSLAGKKVKDILAPIAVHVYEWQ